LEAQAEAIAQLSERRQKSIESAKKAAAAVEMPKPRIRLTLKKRKKKKLLSNFSLQFAERR